jgi:hypothetical protein
VSGFVPFTFTDAQLVDIRRFAGYPAKANGNVVFPAPWINIQYLALEYRLQNMSQSEGQVIVTTYLTNLYTLETAIVGASANLGTAQAAVWTRNKNEVRDRERLFDDWRRRLCQFMGIEPAPGLGDAGLRLVV